MKRKLLVAILIICALVTLACGPCGAISELTGGEGISLPELSSESGDEQPTSPSESTAEPTSPPDQPESEDEEPTLSPDQTEMESEEPTPPLASEESALEVADLNTLNSYRVNITWRGESEDGSESYEMTILEEWVKDPPARYFAMSTTAGGAGGTPMIEMIQVGDTAWMNIGETWIKTEASDESFMGEDLSDAWDGLLMDDLSGMKLANTEKVNGIRCKHYTTDGETTINVPDTEEGGTVKVSFEGEAWVADQADLPAVVVRQRAKMGGGFFPMPLAGADTPSETGTIYWEYDLTDVNAPITIEPPE